MFSDQEKDQATRISRTVLRVHGAILIVVTAALTLSGGLGYSSGQGQFGMLRTEPIGYIGLFQAYLLMATLGVALLVGAKGTRPRAFHLIGALSHAAPLAANLLFWRDIERYGITHAGIAIHLSMMALELGGWIASRPASAPLVGVAESRA